jgi:hypothetical protein
MFHPVRSDAAVSNSDRVLSETWLIRTRYLAYTFPKLLLGYHLCEPMPDALRAVAHLCIYTFIGALNNLFSSLCRLYRPSHRKQPILSILK